MNTTPSFDRVRPRTLDGNESGAADGLTRVPDRDGKRALFSDAPEPPSFGSVAITCTRCESRSVVSWASALRLALPSIPALVPGTGFRLYLKCPTCHRRSWMDLSMRC